MAYFSSDKKSGKEVISLPDFFVLLANDSFRLKVLQQTFLLDLPDCFIGAGFVRNLVWDHLHGFPATPLNDVDVVYFDRQCRFDDRALEQQLAQAMPEVNWQVKNQASMHLRNNHAPYQSTADAISYWPEVETAVAVRLTQSLASNASQDEIFCALELIAPLGIDSLMRGELSWNKKRSKALFLERVSSKGWLEQWPKLKLMV